MAGNHKVVIGIDFGTTYSGVAYAVTGRKKPEVIPITQWPGAEGKQDSAKVPTLIAYLPNGGFKWGYELSADIGRKKQEYTTIRYIKLMLDESQRKGAHRKLDLVDPLGIEEQKEGIPPGKTVVNVVADYLRAVKDHTLQTISKKHLGEKFWETTPIEYHLTVPAVWNEAAKTLTLAAAREAGIGSKEDITLIGEPEAAAQYCLTELHKGLLKFDSVFLVVDCGGGTVDLVTYKTVSTEPRLALKELASGGGYCGSVFLNRSFEAFVRKRLGAQWETLYRNKRHYDKTMADFEERLKRRFIDSVEQKQLDCEVGGIPDDKQLDVEDGYMGIERDEMRSIFEPVVQDIFRFVMAQIETAASSGNPISTVLLVGGFGGSPYLFNRLKSRLEANKITVHQPINAWSAVSRGAVLCGLQAVKIVTRRARHNYGVQCTRVFQHGNHPTKYKYWCPFTEQYRCANRTEWYVKKGDEVSETQDIAMPFTADFDIKKPFKITNQLLASDSPAAQAEENARHHNVRPICTLTTNLEPIRHLFEKKTTTKGSSFCHVPFELLMQIHSAQITFKFRYNGVEYGNITTADFS